MPAIVQRPLEKGPAFYVDPLKGDDARDGAAAQPWKTINHALRQLNPGDTLILRGGTYFENVYCAAAGTADKPITIRSFPGERAIIDGGMPVYQTNAAAWEPFAGGGEGEYVSTQTYRNIRDVVGLFADSNIGLQTYWDLESFRASDVFGDPRYLEHTGGGEALTGYCGPGLWYDKTTGLIHIRLAHTHLPPLDTYQYDNVNYTGETDPRKLPLVIAPFNSVPLYVDQAMHVRFQDIVVRGGAYKTVNLNFGVNIEFDRCSFYGGTYVVWAKSTGPLKMTNCGIYGMIPPWGFRSENILSVYSSYEYPPFLPDKKGYKHISRLPTHALLATEGGFEFETFYYPRNHHWEIANCEFADGHDGPYLSGYDIRFHHNWVDRTQDDGVYISSPSPGFTHSVYIHENYLSAGVSAIGAHGRGGPGGDIYIYRNIMDLRRPMHINRPTPKNPDGKFGLGHSVYFRHGKFLSGENLHFYQNTALIGGITYAGSMWDAGPGAKSRVFNNLVLYREGYPTRWVKAEVEGIDLQMDGNLHWALKVAAAASTNYFTARFALHPAGTNQNEVLAGWEIHSFSADPKLQVLQADWRTANDYRLLPGSAAIGKGVPLPKEYEDPLRPAWDSSPDIGALPSGTAPLRVGIDGRVTAGDLSVPK